MVALGRCFGEAAPDGAVLLLEGPLGAGKTTFAQGVGQGCGVREPIASPTYNLVLAYAGRRPFTHVDLYRLERRDELATLDLDAVLHGEGVTCVEWPRWLTGYVGEPRAEIEIAPLPGGPERRVAGLLVGAGWDAVRACIAAIGGGGPT